MPDEYPNSRLRPDVDRLRAFAEDLHRDGFADLADLVRRVADDLEAETSRDLETPAGPSDA